MTITRRERTDWIVVHCSRTLPEVDIGADEIRAQHLAQGYLNIGYHYVIRRDGRIEPGRHPDLIGNHVAGAANKTAVGILLIGGVRFRKGHIPGATYDLRQWSALKVLTRDLVHMHPRAQLVGHDQLDPRAGGCPAFDVANWWQHRDD